MSADLALLSRDQLIRIILEQRRDLERQRFAYGEALEKVADVAHALRRTYGLEAQPPVVVEPGAVAVQEQLEAASHSMPYRGDWRVGDIADQVATIIREAAPRIVTARQVWVKLGGRPSDPVWYAVTNDLRHAGEIEYTGGRGSRGYLWVERVKPT